MIKRISTYILLGAALVSCSGVGQLSEKEELGFLIFTDSTLSSPDGQSCASCHEIGRGFADPLHRVVSQGATKGRFSKRNSMTVAYSKFVPPLRYDSVEQVWSGGMFWDGRVADLAAQAAEPFVDMLEMGNASHDAVVERVRRAPYFAQLQKLYGKCEESDSIFFYITDALAAYQSAAVVSPFSSKFDNYLAGNATLSNDEQAGLELFRGKALCSQCHPVDVDATAGRVLLTDHTYDNLGIPRNERNPFYVQPPQFNPAGRDYVDLGLGGVLGDADQDGKFRVPTLRNVALTAPYGHNGYFATLGDIVHFYNVRDIDTTTFQAAEYPFTINADELGNLGLTADEERQIVAFMMTLTDE